MERQFSRVEVRGEVSRLTRHQSGHFYFTIKDRHASISAVIWRSTAMRASLLPEEGREFVFSGHISVFEPQGKYQLVVSRVAMAGVGQLAEEFERRKREFAARGWFDQARKRALPALPNHIAIITSPSAAAFEDVKKVLATRPGWLQITLIPALVQGDQAPASVAAAFAALKALPEHPDVVLLVRGGGSMEDLWCFNDEQLVRSVIASPVPVISGVGHEIDTTLADFAADVRAATPSNAAELACPDRATLRRQLPRLPMLQQLLQQQLRSLDHQQGRFSQRLQHGMRLAMDGRHQRVERLSLATADSVRMQQIQARRGLRMLVQRLQQQEPGQRLRRQQQALSRAKQSLLLAGERGLQRQQRPVQAATERLIALDPTRVLQRGFTMALDAQGQLLTSVAGLAAGDALQVQFHDGVAATTVQQIQKET